MPKKIRRTAAPENDFQPDPTLNLEHGAHLRIAGSKLFEPKFNEENGDLWGAMVSLRLRVVDDRTEDGDADDLEFFDRFDLKFDADVAKELQIGPEEGAKDDNGKKLSGTSTGSSRPLCWTSPTGPSGRAPSWPTSSRASMAPSGNSTSRISKAKSS
jgi:hypothetical protein